MFELFATILPLAVASAASPVILGVSVALLSRKNFGAAAALLASGVLAAAILALVGASVAAEDDVVAKSLGFSPAIVDLALGIVFLAFGAKVLLEKPSKEGISRKGAAGWGPAKWFAIGFIGNITNFDAVLLNLAAVREIFNSSLAMASKLELLAFADFFFVLPALLPIAICVLAPAASQKVLVPIGKSMSKYGKYVVGAIFIVFGAYLIVKGI